MILFRGLGFLGILIPFLCAIVCQLVLGEIPFNAGIGYIIGGIINFFIGKNLNKKDDSHYKPVKSILNYIDGRHSLLFIKLEYWSLIAIIIGILVMTPNSDGVFDKFLIAFGYLIMIFCILWLLREGKSISSQVDKYSQELALNKNQDRTLKDQNIDEKSVQLSDVEKSKNTSDFINKLKKNKDKLPDFPKTDHSKYMPKND